LPAVLLILLSELSPSISGPRRSHVECRAPKRCACHRRRRSASEAHTFRTLIGSIGAPFETRRLSDSQPFIIVKRWAREDGGESGILKIALSGKSWWVRTVSGYNAIRRALLRRRPRRHRNLATERKPKHNDSGTGGTQYAMEYAMKLLSS
jgi:hypothetical protein